VRGRKNKGYLEVCFKKKGEGEGKAVVETVNDIWVMGRVCLSTITEDCACSIVLMSCTEIHRMVWVGRDLER